MESELDQRLAEAEEELAVAERALGAVELDGGDVKAATRRVTEARAVVERRRQALVEIERREREEREAKAERQDARARWLVCAWWAEYARRAAPVIELRARLEEAEQHLMSLGHVAAAPHKHFDWVQDEAVAGRLSLEALNALPDTAVVDASHASVALGPVVRGNVGKLTVEECEAWAPKLDELARAAAEALGDVAAETPPWAGEDAETG